MRSSERFYATLGFTLPDEYKVAEQDYFLNRRRYQWARNRLSFLDKPERPYVHIMDGGLADNIGLRAIDSAYRRGFIRHRLNDGLIEKLVVVVVNARTEAQDEVMRMEAPRVLPSSPTRPRRSAWTTTPSRPSR
jgi:NTE family protein